MNKSHFQMMAGYGAWANRRLVTACRALSEDAYHADRGAFFSSIHGTLNHILVGDRVWLGRITGIDSGLRDLDARLFDTREGLAAARSSEDQRIEAVIDAMPDAAFDGSLTYTTLVKPTTISTPMRQVLTHLFNHATHHRGQVHGLLSQVPSDPPSLDLIVYLRKINS
ncbi:MAG: damage-inducible protein DinB [Rhodospirillales bacterium]|nr:damage-inducible protein DinB [Rhodospirillales bacterium]